MPRILIVEDNLVNREFLLALLEGEGYEVLTAGTAEAGVALVAGERPDLVLMDVQLPGKTGYDATRQLKADPATAAIPVIAVTALAMRGEEARARDAGCDAYITKPVDTRALRDLLRRYFGSPPTSTAPEA
jgi:two-component system cell cycle response regulator DivK